MDVSKAIKDRRSIKNYKSKDVPLKDILECIDAAHYAPSSGNLQNWKFIIIKDHETKQKLAENCLEQLWMCEAPALIVICSDRDCIESYYEQHKNIFSIQNCALAAQNFMLRAHSLKLGTCFVSGFSKMQIKRILKIDEGVEPEAIITLGYPSEKPISKRHHIETCTFFETYGNRRADKSLFPLSKHVKSVKNLFSKFKKN
ncbi:MAG: nitroreductase [Nanoarchaeota archaeon]|nr:nitroreductase [Nanoarchaeota archaeon]|tara:strand:- start:281 stop:883 length:603 start_codon:yes stop_codon:yes gene_type:complete